MGGASATIRSDPAAPALRGVDLGDLERVDPISRTFGFDRGSCIDRRYIEQFLSREQASIRGRVLEVAENTYTRRFGGSRVTQSDVLFTEPDHRNGTLVGDLTRAETLPSEAFDCVVLTQTLQHIYDTRAAVNTLHRILKPTGVVLATVPGISHVSRFDMDRWGDFWRFTTASAARLFGDVFGEANVRVEAFGNVYAAVGLLHGLAVEDLDAAKLDGHDRDYQVIVTVVATKI